MYSAEAARKTGETDLFARIELAGGETKIATGIGFFDHMLTAFSVHAGFGLTVSCIGDLGVDGHHTVEDTGIVLGRAFREALAGMRGFTRFGSAYIPMDEALAFCAVDISGRPFLRYDAKMPQDKIGEYDSCLTEEFMRAFAMNAGVTLHLKVLYGENAHHMTEALFKALAHALKAAVKESEKILSTKGVL